MRRARVGRFDDSVCLDFLSIDCHGGGISPYQWFDWYAGVPRAPIFACLQPQQAGGSRRWHGESGGGERTAGGSGFRDDPLRHHEIPLSITLNLGHSAMHASRFWVGAVALTVVAFGLLIATSRGHHAGSGPVRGRVTYNGRPVIGGTIMFISEDTRRSDDRWVWIDRSGHYECGTDWRRDRATPTRFRICVVLDASKYPLRPRRTDVAGMRVPPQGGGTGRLPRGGGGPAPIALPAVYAPSGPPGLRTANSTATERRFGNPNTTDLAVHLGPEPATINVDLTD